eukprot:993681-Amphidinium_carterae.1
MPLKRSEARDHLEYSGPPHLWSARCKCSNASGNPNFHKPSTKNGRAKTLCASAPPRATVAKSEKSISATPNATVKLGFVRCDERRAPKRASKPKPVPRTVNHWIIPTYKRKLLSLKVAVTTEP